MKRTQRIDAIRNIRRQFVSFLSILIVTALGVGIYLACRNGALAIQSRGNDFYRETAYRDAQILATHGITKEDVEAVRSLDGVTDAEGFFAFDMVAESGGGRTPVHVISKTERIDRPVVSEGRLPEAKNECAVEAGLLETFGLSVGDTLAIKGENGGASYDLREEEFRITGVILHPDNIHRGIRTSSYVMLPAEVFSGSSEDGIDYDWAGMLVRADLDADSFSDEYAEGNEELMRRLTAFGQERAAMRDEKIRADAQAKIDDARAQLADGREQIGEGRDKVESGREELKNVRQQLDDAAAKLAEAEEQLITSEQDLKDNKTKLDDAKASLDSAKAQLDDGRAKLDSGKAQLDSAKAQLDSGKARLDSSHTRIANGKAQLDEACAKLVEGQELLETAYVLLTELHEDIENRKADLPQTMAQLNAAVAGRWKAEWGEVPVLQTDMTKTAAVLLEEALDRAGTEGENREAAEAAIENDEEWTALALDYDTLPQNSELYELALPEYESGVTRWEDGNAEYNEKLAQYNAGVAEYNEGLAKYNASLAEYNQGLSQYNEKLGEYNANYALYESNLAQYESGLERYEAGVAEFQAAKEKYESGKKDYEAGELSYQDNEKKLEDSERELTEKEAEADDKEGVIRDSEERLAAMEDGHWIILDRTVNLSWGDLKESSRTFRSIGNTFALLFVLLAVLVCYATIGKIIDEQRTLVGTTKALGFHSSEIRGKYLVFGIGSAVLGSAAGLALSYFVLEKMILRSVGNAYYLGTFPKVFRALPAVLAVVIAAAVAFFATWVACRKLLAESATRLMSGELPPAAFREKKEKEGQKETSLYRGLILRNMRSDWKRVLITVISIAGCCMLLMIGFSLKSSFDNVIRRQYDEILNHDATVRFLPKASEKAEAEISGAIEKLGAEAVPFDTFGTIIRIGETREPVKVICADPEAIGKCYRLTDAKKKTALRIPDEGAVIFSRLAEKYGLEIGSTLSVLDSGGEWHDVPVTGIYTNYAGRNIFLSSGYAEKTFGEKIRNNEFDVKLSGADTKQLKEALKDEESFLDVKAADEERDRYARTSKAMDSVILVMILMAAIMAAVVLLNLLRIQINQKKRELTIMRINGFTTGETVGYILRENVITTLLGILLGIAAGCIASGVILRSIERVDLQMMREISLPACALSALITLGFAAVMNFLALRKIRKLKLSDINS